MEYFLLKKHFSDTELHVVGTVFGMLVLAYMKGNCSPIFGPCCNFFWLMLQPILGPYGGQFVAHKATNFECNSEMNSSILY